MDSIAEIPALDPRRHADDLRQTWQGRMLAETQKKPMGPVVLSMLAHVYDIEPVQTLLRVVFPGFRFLGPGFICSAAKVDKAGRVIADVVDKYESLIKDAIVFRSLDRMKYECRKLADRMKLSDQERLEFFAVAQRWVVADRRLDPNMNPADPDAKRLTVH